MTRPRSIDKRPQGQRGVILILFALLLLVLLGFTALAIDVARMNLTKVELQNAADAAALAGAYKYAKTTSLSAAIAEAKSLATSNEANGLSIPDAAVTPTEATGTGHPYAIRVTITLAGIQLFFAPVLGIASTDVSASAVAAADTVVPPAKPTPILVQ